MPLSKFPRLAYVGDVPVANTSSGMLLLYRLFEAYPPDRLMVFETLVSPEHSRLAAVKYHRFSKVLARLRRTRYHHAFNALAIALAGLESRTVIVKLREAGIEAIVTVTHGTSWLVADRVAKALNVPLILINHDYWFDTCPVLAPPAQALHEIFGRVYKRAKKRLCVSPQMEEYYRERYGSEGSVLYPYRAATATWGDAPSPTQTRAFTVAYAGTVTYTGFRDALQALARALAKVGGVVLLFSNLSGEEAASLGGAAGNVVSRGFVPSTEIVDCLRNEADAVFLPMTSAMGINMRLSFPSKLADYTAAGLPIIVWAPTDSSAHFWALENPVAAIAIPEGDEALLESWMACLASDTALRMRMGEAAIAAGRQYFDGKNAPAVLISAITSSSDS